MDILLFFLDYHLVYGSYSSSDSPENMNEISVGDGQDIGGWGWPVGSSSGVFSMTHFIAHQHVTCCSTARGSLLWSPREPYR